MNWKRYWLSSAAVFVVAKGLVAILFFAIIFDFVYDQELPGARPEGEEFHAAGFLSMIVWSLAYTYFYVKGFKNKGLTEGVIFGLLVWAFYFIPMISGYWAYFEMPVNWVIAGLVSGLAESLVAGILVALIYKPEIVLK